MKVLIAGGGTGGHFYSGQAVGEAFAARDAGNQVVYVGTRTGIEARAAVRDQLDVRFIRVSGLKGKGAAARLRGLVRLPLALWDSLVLLARLRPDLVVGVGGFASGPVTLTARALGLHTAVVEQNSIPGFTNKVLGRVVHRVYVGFPEAVQHFGPGKAVYTGNPIRRKLVEGLTLDTHPPHPERGELRVLAFGGSQGAHSINLALVQMVPHLPEALRARLRLVHQTGTADLEEVKAGYAAAGFDGADVQPFIHDMHEAYAWADLLVCRAGASTLAEVTVARRPAVLIPFPHAIYNHQEVNARSLVDRGAARLLRNSDLDGRTLARVLVELASDPEALRRMAQASGELGRPQAAFEVVDDCTRLVRGR